MMHLPQKAYSTLLPVVVVVGEGCGQAGRQRKVSWTLLQGEEGQMWGSQGSWLHIVKVQWYKALLILQ